MDKKAIQTEQAPAAVGPYSQAIVAGQFVYTAGQIPLDPVSGQIITGDISDQTRRVLENLKAVLAAAGSSLSRAVKTTVYLADMEQFAAMNTVYAEYFEKPYPARTTIEAARLPRGALIEIDVVALTNQ